jgi:UDP-2,4-diacetamido-2,4,6-trideoxy-beta-L-altropyranose hydrolase
MSMAGKSILFRCDASPVIGGGHVMRCLTLGNALAEAGCRITFAATRQALESVPRLASSGHGLVLLETVKETAFAVPDGGRIHDWIVIDHYGLGLAEERALSKHARRLAVIDDAPDRDHDCDLLIDQNFGADAESYRGRVPAHCTVLAGSQYALLRPEFARAREAALERRGQSDGISRVLVSMGMTDLGGVTGDAVDAVLAVPADIDIDVVLAENAPSMPRLQALQRQNGRISIHCDVADMTGLMTRADLCVGAAGSTSWERCCLGLPTIMVVLAGNQKVIAEALARTGAALLAENIAAIGGMLAQCDPQSLRAMSRAAAGIVDGEGAARVAGIIAGCGTFRALAEGVN